MWFQWIKIVKCSLFKFIFFLIIKLKQCIVFVKIKSYYLELTILADFGKNGTTEKQNQKLLWWVNYSVRLLKKLYWIICSEKFNLNFCWNLLKCQEINRWLQKGVWNISSSICFCWERKILKLYFSQFKKFANILFFHKL